MLLVWSVLTWPTAECQRLRVPNMFWTTAMLVCHDPSPPPVKLSCENERGAAWEANRNVTSLWPKCHLRFIYCYIYHTHPHTTKSLRWVVSFLPVDDIHTSINSCSSSHVSPHPCRFLTLKSKSLALDPYPSPKSSIFKHSSEHQTSQNENIRQLIAPSYIVAHTTTTLQL